MENCVILVDKILEASKRKGSLLTTEKVKKPYFIKCICGNDINQNILPGILG